MADPFKMVVVIVALGVGVKLAKLYYDDRRREYESRQPDDGAARRIVELEERIKVLEAIVTDDRTQLRREIDSL